jgi:hypothetical protein
MTSDKGHTPVKFPSRPPAPSVGVGHVKQRRGALLGPLTATIIAGGRVYRRVAGELLRDRDVGAGVEQVTDEGAAKVVRRERRDSRLGRATAEHVEDGLVSEGTEDQPAGLRNRNEEWRRRRLRQRPPTRDPATERPCRSTLDVDGNNILDTGSRLA